MKIVKEMKRMKGRHTGAVDLTAAEGGPGDW